MVVFDRFKHLVVGLSGSFKAGARCGLLSSVFFNEEKAGLVNMQQFNH